MSTATKRSGNLSKGSNRIGSGNVRSVKFQSDDQSSDKSRSSSQASSVGSSNRPTSGRPPSGRPSSSRPGSARRTSSSRAASIAASAGGANSTRPQVKIWPEWTEPELAAEKWDGKGGKTEKGKSPVASQLFDDPEGKIDMPLSLKVVRWIRACDYIADKTPVVVDPDGMASFDLIQANEHIHESELMRYIISQISALWEMSLTPNPPTESVDPAIPVEALAHTWRPWEHIYTSKPQKGPHVPQYSSYGKYVVKLYWMGCWRKLTVDDSLPLDENDRLLLPATTMSHELWPMLLTKALIKVASLDYAGGSSSSEFGDCSIVQCLTSWIPESIPLQSLVCSSSDTTDPLVPASLVLDKYFQLSSQSRQKDEETPRRVKSANGALQVVRQGFQI